MNIIKSKLIKAINIILNNKTRVFFPLILLFIFLTGWLIVGYYQREFSKTCFGNDNSAQQSVKEEKCDCNNTPHMIVRPTDFGLEISSPLIYLENNIINILHFDIPQQWEVKEMDFDRSIYGIYFLKIVNREKHDYELRITKSEGSSSYCDFENVYVNETPWNMDLIDYLTIDSSFGKLRIGYRKYRQHDSDTYGYIFRFCQQMIINEHKGVEWLDDTKIGIIEIFVPEDYDVKLVEEAIQMVINIKIVEYKKVNQNQ